MQTGTMRIIDAINAKRTQQNVTILWPDLQVYHYLHIVGLHSISLLYQYCTMTKMHFITTNLAQYILLPQILQSYTHIAVLCDKEQVKLILSERSIAIDEIVQLRNCWRMSIFQFSRKVHVWGLILKPNKRNENQKTRIITPHQMKEKKNLLFIDVDMEKDDPNFEEVYVIGNNRKPMYSRFYCSDEIPTSAFLLYHFKLQPLEGWFQRQLSEIEEQMQRYRFSEFQENRRTSFRIEEKQQGKNQIKKVKMKECQYHCEEQKDEVKKLNFAQPSITVIKENLAIEQISEVKKKLMKEYELLKERKTSQRDDDMIVLSIKLVNLSLKKEIRKKSLLHWNNELDRMISKKKDKQEIELNFTDGYEFSSIGLHHLEFLKICLETNLQFLNEEKNFQDLLILLKLSLRLNVPILSQIFLNESIQFLNPQMWNYFWSLVNQSQTLKYQSHFLTQLSEFFIHHSNEILTENNLSLFCQSIIKKQHSKMLSKALYHVKNYSHLQNLLSLISKINKNQSILEYTIQQWGLFNPIQPLQMYSEFNQTPSFEDFTTFVVKKIKLKKSNLKSFHFEIGKKVEGDKNVIQFFLSIPNSDKPFTLALPPIFTLGLKMNFYFEFDQRIKVYLSLEEEKQKREVFIDEFSQIYLCKLFNLSISFNGEEGVVRANKSFISILKRGQANMIKCEEHRLLSGIKSAEVRLEVGNLADYSFLLQYLCADWKNMFAYEQKDERMKNRLSEILNRKGKRNSQLVCQRKSFVWVHIHLEKIKISLFEECFHHSQCHLCEENQALRTFCTIPQSVLVHILSSDYLQVKEEPSLLLLLCHYYCQNEKEVSGEGFYCLRYEFIPFKYLALIFLRKGMIRKIAAFMDIFKNQFRRKILGRVREEKDLKLIGRIKSEVPIEVQCFEELEEIEKEGSLSQILKE